MVAAFAPFFDEPPALAQTPRAELWRDGTARLYRFRRPDRSRSDGPAAGPLPMQPALPVLLVPSMINRWYVLDLRPGSSLAEALVQAGHDVWCLDWGEPEAEDRYLSWTDVLDRLGRMVRRVQRECAVQQVGLLGYCMGATLAGIYTALEPQRVAAFVNLAGPFDFAHAGCLGRMTDSRWFDAEAVAAAGNVTPDQMQSGFTSMRPTAQLAKWLGYADRAHDPEARAAFAALEAWAGDNIAFPAAAYATYITELYQQNGLVNGTHHVRGRRVDLGAVTCPLLTLVADRDTICPPAAAAGLERLAASADKQTLVVPGGHVGAVVGRRASTVLYPAVDRWLRQRLAGPAGA